VHGNISPSGLDAFGSRDEAHAPRGIYGYGALATIRVCAK
jgi:hypothetical protein